MSEVCSIGWSKHKVVSRGVSESVSSKGLRVCNISVHRVLEAQVMIVIALQLEMEVLKLFNCCALEGKESASCISIEIN